MKVACVLITHLPMKAELRRRTHLRGRPVIVTEGSGSRQSVLDRSPEAAGVGAGMPLQEALSRCKGATLLQADAPYYRETFDGVMDLLAQRSPLVEAGDLGCAYVGVNGLEGMYGGEARLVTSLLQAAPLHFNPRLGLGDGKFPAYVAAALSGRGRATRVPSDAAAFLRDLPVDLLPISWDSKARLHRFGLHAMGQLASLSLGAVQAQFGVEGKRAWELANGVDRSPLVAHVREEVVREHLVFPSPVTTLQAITLAVEILLGRAFASSTMRGRSVRAAVLESRVFRGPPWTRRFAFREAVSGKERAFDALKGALEGASIPGPIEEMFLTLSGLAGEARIQASLFPDARRREHLQETMRQLEARLDRKPPIYRVRDVEPWSRMPERRRALVQFDP